MTATLQPSRLAAKDFLSVLDLAPAEFDRLLSLASELKQLRARGAAGPQPLAGRHVAILFEKPSLRTRITFVIAVRELGGEVIEPPPDVTLRRCVTSSSRSGERRTSRSRKR